MRHGTPPERFVREQPWNIGKWGRRLFINVQANDQTLKLFDNGKQLAEAIIAAGFSNLAEKIAEGVAAEPALPCRHPLVKINGS